MPQKIASYATSNENTKGRNFPETSHQYRSDFERDRDRIIHSEAFRRLEGKTQVFTPGLDDNYRNRLTHSLEVAQIGRTIARNLQLNESLTEAICLAHDLGHSPFGHAGEDALDAIMADFGGFEHNRQSLRIVDLLEHPYPDFVGLNLMYETRLGLAKHRTSYDISDVKIFDQANCSLEGQVADIADRIAYNCHDLEDGMRGGLIGGSELETLQLFSEAQKKIKVKKIKYSNIQGIRTAKAIVDKLVSDCIEQSKKNIIDAKIKTVEDVYQNTKSLICLSDEIEQKLLDLEKFLLNKLYLHNLVKETTDKVRNWLKQLFERFCNKAELMPAYFQDLSTKQGLQRAVCDYVAGMTDRFCLRMLEEI